MSPRWCPPPPAICSFHDCLFQWPECSLKNSQRLPELRPSSLLFWLSCLVVLLFQGCTANNAKLSDPDMVAPSAPAGLAATAASATQVNLSWTASTDNVGVTGYYVERCVGNLCTTFAQAAMTTGTSYSDTGLLGNTSYGYRVRATDAAGNLSSYSNIPYITTPKAADTTPPSTPTNLAATAASGTQIGLTWTASTDNVGVTGYLIYRCSGAGCTAFVKIGTSTTTTFTTTCPTASTSYSYEVQATDAAANGSVFSYIASASTASSGGSSITVSVSPRRGGFTTSQNLPGAAPRTNDSPNPGRGWARTSTRATSGGGFASTT